MIVRIPSKIPVMFNHVNTSNYVSYNKSLIINQLKLKRNHYATFNKKQEYEVHICLE